MDVGSDFELPVEGRFLLSDASWRWPFSAFLEGGTVTFTDSGRSSLRLALRSLGYGVGRVLVPAYTCSSVLSAIRAEGYTPYPFSVKANLTVNVDKVLEQTDSTVVGAVLTDYFGFHQFATLATHLQQKGVSVIYDITHSLLSSAVSPQFLASADIVVASLRKLLPLSDGGLMYSARCSVAEVDHLGPAPHADARMSAMIWKAACTAGGEEEARPFRSGFLTAEEMLDHQESLFKMSRTSQRVIQLLDIPAIIRQRRENYQELLRHSAVWGKAIVPLFAFLPDDVCPLGFPVLTRSQEERDSLRQHLIGRNIFPPIHWPLEADQLESFPEAKWLSERIMTIPCDQRYTSADMAVVAKSIEDWGQRVNSEVAPAETEEYSGIINGISLQAPEEWRKTITACGPTDIYFMPDYIEPFAGNGDGEARLLSYKHALGQVVYPILVRPISVPNGPAGYFDFTSPYGYTGPFVAAADKDRETVAAAFAGALRHYCAEQRIVAGFTRFHPLLETEKPFASLIPVHHVGDTVYVDLTADIDRLWTESFDGRTRTAIRKAQRLGVEVNAGNNPDFLERFVGLYQETMSRLDAKAYYFFSQQFYERLATTAKEIGMFFEAWYQGRLIASVLLLRGQRFLHYHLAGSSSAARDIPANNLLLFEAIKWGQELGLEKFHLGGGYAGSTDSLFRFKAGFSPNRASYRIGKSIFLPKVHAELVAARFRGSMPATDFFPLYRLSS